MKLVRFLSKCANQPVSIELKSGATVAGTIASVDVQMNTHLRKVTITPKRKDTPAETHDVYTVRGSAIRNIVLPDSLPLDAILQDVVRSSKHSNSGTRGAARPKGGDEAVVAERHGSAQAGAPGGIQRPGKRGAPGPAGRQPQRKTRRT